MAADVASSTAVAVDANNATVTVPSGTTDGDLLVVVAVKDRDTASTNGTMSAAWTPKSTIGTANHIKTWYRYASSEPASYTYTGPSGSSSAVFCLRITGGPTAGDPFETGPTSAESLAAPSQSPAGSTSLLIAGASEYNGNPGDAWTPATGMTELHDARPAASYINACIAKQQLSASGATGTRTFTQVPASGPSRNSFSFTIASSGGSSAFSGNVAVSGSGTLTLAGTPSPTGGANLSGSGSLGFTATPSIPGAVALSGSGTVTLGALPAIPGTVTLSGSGALTLAATLGFADTATLSGSGTLTLVGLVVSTGTVSLSGSGSLSTSATPGATGTAGLSGSGALTASGIPGDAEPESHSGLVMFSGSGSLATLTTGVALTGTVSLGGVGALAIYTNGDAMYLFRPPGRMLPMDPTGKDFLYSKVHYRVGDAVIKYTSGSFRTVQLVDPNEPGVEKVYHGGHDHYISDAEALPLIQAGYGEYMEVVS